MIASWIRRVASRVIVTFMPLVKWGASLHATLFGFSLGVFSIFAAVLVWIVLLIQMSR